MSFDYKYAIYEEAERLAEERYGKEFYDLPKEVQNHVYCAAMDRTNERLWDAADAAYDRMREEGKL